MKTLIFHDDAGRVVSWCITTAPEAQAVPDGLSAFVADGEIPDPAACRVVDGALVPAEPDLDRAMADLRLIRDAMLADTDWRVIAATEAGQPLAPEWRAYRQALRDLPASTTNPADPEWPQKPE